MILFMFIPPDAAKRASLSFQPRRAATTNLFPNPISVNSPGQYTFIVTDTLNGCIDSSSLMVSLYQPIPNIKITGYPSITPSMPLDTINCYNPFLDLIGFSDTASTTVYFTDTAQVMNYGDSIQIDSSGFYYLLAINSITGCKNFIGFYIASFFNQPDLLMPISPEINCSVDSVILNASTILSGTYLTWSGPSVFSQANPIVATLPGYYFATNFDSTNGCFRTDSALVNFVPEIITSIGSDTVVCKGSNLTLIANCMGSFTSLNYLWSNGDTTPNSTINILCNSFVTVNVDDGSGCVGIDSIYIDVPNTPVDSIVGFKPCGSDSTGQLVIYLSAGLSPYTYSLDGSTFQSLNQFSNLSIGNYTVFVKDSLGCDYNYSTSITSSSSLPQPFFLNSTYNSLDDTIVLVDISAPTPDSIQWILPSVFDLIEIGELISIKSSDTGKFQITMRAFYADCSVDTSKLIYIRENDTSLANLLNENGIKKLILFANPNNGLFTVELEFYKKQDYLIGIYDVNSINWFSNYAEESFGQIYSINISDAISGTYVLRVISEFDSKSLNFIIQH